MSEAEQALLLLLQLLSSCSWDRLLCAATAAAPVYLLHMGAGSLRAPVLALLQPQLRRLPGTHQVRESLLPESCVLLHA